MCWGGVRGWGGGRCDIANDGWRWVGWGGPMTKFLRGAESEVSK